jgi:hypothetical protein
MHNVYALQDGAAVVAVWVVGDVVLVANVGDAKCVLARTPEQVSQAQQQAPPGPCIPSSATVAVYDCMSTATHVCCHHG